MTVRERPSASAKRAGQLRKKFFRRLFHFVRFAHFAVHQMKRFAADCGSNKGASRPAIAKMRG
jgi:hypothetical protein